MTSMHAYIYTNTTAGSAASGRIQHAVTTGAVGRRLQHPGCGRRRDLIMKETHGISILIPLEADISRGCLHHQVRCLHHYGVEGTTACQVSS